MATFYNQATLSFGGGVVNSNVTEAEVLSGISLTKTAFNTSYGAGDGIVYAITLTNQGQTPLTGLTVTDNLGAYTTTGGSTAVPLSYVDGSIVYYLGGVVQPTPTVSTAGNLEISGINIPAGGTATFVYEARANEFAPIAQGSTITNVATSGDLTASATVTAEETQSLTIAKAVCPAVLADNGTLTYTLIVQNLGNTPVVATDGVTLSDMLSPILSDIAVTLDGAPLAEGTGYTYNETTGEFSTVDGVITVPAATYTQDPTTGVVTTTPGVTVITITGTV